MKHQKITFNTLLSRYNKYRNKLIRLNKAGKNKHRQLVLKRHIERLYLKLSSATLSISKKAALAASFTAVMTMSSENAVAQTQFKENMINQFSLTPLSGSYIYASLAHVDLDNDGDFDLLTNQYDGNFRYFENTGSSSAPVYSAPLLNPFSLADIGGYGLLTVADLDNDGDTDILINQYGSGSRFKFIENIGSSNAPNFATEVSDPFGLTSSANVSNMQLIDIDGDNDLDLCLMDGNFNYFENTGDIYNPSFGPIINNPYPLSHLTYQGRFVDLDNDGDVDILGLWGSTPYYFENNGTATNPNFAAAIVTPFNFRTTYSNISGVDLFDIDGDNDLDLIYNDSKSGDFHSFKNIGSVTSPQFSDGHTNLFSLTELGSTPDPTFGDLDNDGDLDMLTEVNGVLYYFENTGNASNPNFAAAVQNPFSLPGYGYNGNNCTLVDIDGDNDLDLFMSYSNNFQFIENVGTASSPSFGAVQNSPFGIQNGNGFQFPDFVDLDNDGDFDLISQSGIYGDIYYYENTGSSTAPSFETPVINPFGFVVQTDRDNITVGDIDGDGDYDLIAGKSEGLTMDEFYFYENIGTASSPNFALSLADPFNLRPVGSNNANPISTAPCFVDLNNDGDMDLMIGAQPGYFTYFENISASTAGISKALIETISIYPNPSNDFITINTAEQIERIHLFDITGDLVQTEKSNHFSIEKLSTGVYIVDVKTASGLYRTRLVKK